LPNSRLLIHQPLIGGNVQGQASDIEITAREILKTRERIVELYHRETAQSMERLQRDIERDYWMTASEAKEYGLITKIISNASEIMK
jgi:ATP-dependent Clp protease, protease subunit